MTTMGHAKGDRAPRFDDFLADFSVKYGTPTDRMVRFLRIAYESGRNDGVGVIAEAVTPLLASLHHLDGSQAHRILGAIRHAEQSLRDELRAESDDIYQLVASVDRRESN